MNDDDEPINIYADLKEVETINGKPFYRCMAEPYTTKDVLEKVFKVSSLYDLAEQDLDFYRVQDKMMDSIKERLDDGSLFETALKSNGIHAVDYLIENYGLNSYLVDQVIDEQAPYLTHYVSNKDWYDGDGYEVDKELFKDFYKEYYSNNNSELERKVKKYFDNSLSYSWDTPRTIFEKSEFHNEYRQTMVFCRDVVDHVKVLKRYNLHIQDCLDKWIDSKIESNATASRNPQDNLDDFIKFSKMYELNQKLNQKLQPRQSQTNKKSKGFTRKI